MNIFVAKLDFGTTEEDVRAAFEKFGEVSSAKVITDKFTGESKGFGFVEMPNEEEGREAINSLNQSDLGGKTILVKDAAEPNERRGGAGGRRPRIGGGGRGGYGGGRDRGGYGGGGRGGYGGGGGYGGNRDSGERYYEGSAYDRNRNTEPYDGAAYLKNAGSGGDGGESDYKSGNDRTSYGGTYSGGNERGGYGGGRGGYGRGRGRGGYGGGRGRGGYSGGRDRGGYGGGRDRGGYGGGRDRDSYSGGRDRGDSYGGGSAYDRSRRDEPYNGGYPNRDNDDKSDNNDQD